MIDIGKGLQRAYSDGYKCGRLEALDELLKYIGEMGDYEADRKTEPQTHEIRTNTHECVKDTHDKTSPNSSEIPNNCEVECEKCKHFREEADTYMKQCEYYFMECRFEPKDEPTISKMEQVEDEPQTCDTCKWGEWYRKGYDITMIDDECGGCCSWRSKWTPKDEPQTEREGE